MLLVSVRDFDRVNRSAGRAERILGLSAAAERHVVDVETGLRGYLLTGDAGFLEPYHAGRLRQRADLAAMGLLITDPAQQRRLRRADARRRRLRRGLRRAAAHARRATSARRGRRGDGRRQAAPGRAARTFDAFNRAEERISAARRARAASRGDRVGPDRRRRRGRRRARAAPARLLPAPRRAAPGAPRRASPPRRLAAGDRDARVPAGGRGEVALLGASFNAMAEALGAREEDLRVAGDRLQGILDHATTMISVKDVDGRYLLVGRAWEQATGQVGGRRRSAAPTPSCCPADVARRVARRRPRGHPHRRAGRVRARRRSRGGRALPPDRQVPAQGRRRRRLRRRPRWPPTSPTASARWPRRSRPRARSPSSWPT